MREDRWNVAVVRPLVDSSPMSHTTRHKKQMVKKLPLGEKWLYLFSILFCVILAFFVLSQLVNISQLNVCIARTEAQIQQTQRVNLRLETDRGKLESIDRIGEYAKRKGMELKPQKRLSSIQPSF